MVQSSLVLSSCYALFRKIKDGDGILEPYLHKALHWETGVGDFPKDD